MFKLTFSMFKYRLHLTRVLYYERCSINYEPPIKSAYNLLPYVLLQQMLNVGSMEKVNHFTPFWSAFLTPVYIYACLLQFAPFVFETLLRPDMYKSCDSVAYV